MVQALQAERQRIDIPATGIELILAGNGPGELAGWIRPTAEAARAAAAAGERVRLTLALLPTQFAGGGELETVRSWGLFDRIIPPITCLRLAAGLGSLEVLPRAVLVHLGGDPWVSARLSSRLGLRACAFSETELIAKRHRGFDRIFVPTADHAARLRTRGVPAAKIVVTGDPRAGAAARAREDALSSRGPGGRRTETIALLPGSRDRVFRAAVSLVVAVAGRLAAMRPRVTFQVVVSPFISPATLLAAQREAARIEPGLDLQWITGNRWSALMGATFALTLPGTMTLELAAAGIPFGLILHTDYIGLASVEGPLEWIARFTGVHRLIKHTVLNRYRRRAGFLALPNQRAGREVVPEWVGRWTAQEIANRVNGLLDDRLALAETAAALTQLYGSDASAASQIVSAAFAVADPAWRPQV